MCGPEDPLFTPLLPLARVPFQAKESVHKAPFWENLEILASTALIFAQILALKPPNLEIFSSQAPNLEIFSSQPPLFRGKYQLASPTLQKSGPHTPTWKKVECPRDLTSSLVVGLRRDIVTHGPDNVRFCSLDSVPCRSHSSLAVVLSLKVVSTH